MPTRLHAAGIALLFVAASACGKEEAAPPAQPPGAPKKTDTVVLSKAAEAVQDLTPVRAFDVYLDGFHVMKEHPDMTIEAHHYCRAKNEEVMQCVIFDGTTTEANLIGLEYVISESLFDGLPKDEKPYWHPHNYEILSGELVGPGLPDPAEKAFLAKKVNSYGKTWHVWDTGHTGHPAASPLPMGEPQLAWSFNADGEIPPSLLEARDARLNVSTAAKRASRADLAAGAHPQEGVDALKRAFPSAKGRPPGVAAKP